MLIIEIVISVGNFVLSNINDMSEKMESKGNDVKLMILSEINDIFNNTIIFSSDL